MASRVYFASQGVAIDDEFITGVQSVGISINYSLEQAFQLGVLGIYDQIATDAEVGVTITKNLDGGGLLGTGKITIASTNDGTALSTSGVTQTVTVITGALVNSQTFNFPADGWATQEVSYFADNKSVATSGISGITVPNGVTRNIYRHHVDVVSGGPGGNITNVTISTDYNLTPMFRLGQLKPHTRYTDYPVETTVEVTIDNTAVDNTTVNLDDISCSGTAVTTNDFIIQVCRSNYSGSPAQASGGSGCTLGNQILYYFRVPKVTLSSVTQDGGDTGGGNASTTYTYIGYDGVSHCLPSGSGGSP